MLCGPNTRQRFVQDIRDAEKRGRAEFRRGQLAGIRPHPSADSRHFTRRRYDATSVIRAGRRKLDARKIGA